MARTAHVPQEQRKGKADSQRPMRPLPQLQSPQPQSAFSLRITAIAVLLVVQSGFMLAQVVPNTIWAAHGFPNGPIPTSLDPLVAGLFYVIPTAVGLLSRRWQTAIVLATVPAWLVLGAFAVGGAVRNTPFYLEQDPHATGTVGTLELMAFLGALGWLARDLVSHVVARRGKVA